MEAIVERSLWIAFSLTNKQVPNLHYPLQTVVDYCGRRLVVSSVLPIDPSQESSTMVYGTSDGGQSGKDPFRVDDCYSFLIVIVAVALSIS